MIIRGILDHSLNGQLCIRGFASIKELARISKADYKYQRNPIEGRTDIIDFLDKEPYLFFPEIILSYKFKHDLSVEKNMDKTPLKEIQLGNRYKSNRENVSIQLKTAFNSASDKGVKIIELNIDETCITEKPFHRIDGNHRLLAAEKSESDNVGRMVAPFCIILGEEFYNEEGSIIANDSTKAFDKATKVFFHNINTKTIPLTSEENLRVILDDSVNFPDSELIEILGDAGVKSRALINKIDPKYFTGISHIISNQFRSYYIDVFKLLLNNENVEKDNLVDDVSEALKTLDDLYRNNQKLKSNSSFGLLTAFLYYKVNGISRKFEFFKEWVLQNHIFEIEEIKPHSIIKIFNKIADQEIKIFVAMPYFEGDPNIVQEYNTVYSNVIEKIKTEINIKIYLYPIMQNKGETQDQIQDIINKIQSCEIFIADITNNNANVSYEMGWARALKKPTIIVIEKTSESPKSDYQNDTYHQYDKNCLNISLSEVVKKNILEILNKNYGVVISN
ncbi:hypothetical protein HW49_05090 [Porphyromonadaceae bacterium COT-184 OH4590]|nr:hypothetical protein HW49_05090 [Porphyromonadaceae bacterium COT-184 OH4590]